VAMPVANTFSSILTTYYLLVDCILSLLKAPARFRFFAGRTCDRRVRLTAVDCRIHRKIHLPAPEVLGETFAAAAVAAAAAAAAATAAAPLPAASEPLGPISPAAAAPNRWIHTYIHAYMHTCIHIHR